MLDAPVSPSDRKNLNASDDPYAVEIERAFLRILAGDEAGGVGAYQRLLQVRSVAFTLRTGAHLALLRSAGREEAAAVLERFALEKGSDLLAALTLDRMPAARRVEAYRDLFSRGLVNAAMLAHYADALSEVGDEKALSDLMRPEELVHVSRPDWQADDGSGRSLHQALDALIMDLKEQADWAERGLSRNRMFVLNKVLERDHPLIRRLSGLLREKVEATLAGFSGYASCHRLSDWPRPVQRMGSWVLYSDHDGCSVPHIHPRGILSGVYYLAAEDAAGEDMAPDVGALTFRHGVLGRAECSGWPTLTAPVTPGALVTFPSYFTHYRLATERPCRRVALVFDAEFAADTGSVNDVYSGIEGDA